jgi:hypothetical protein
VRRLACRDQVVLMPIRLGFDVHALRRAGVGMFIARQPCRIQQSEPTGSNNN